ncbi:MAG: YbaN family protein [Burkholderiaceae bacterium]|nr:YbaN family protein [Burkholderiaceae bacterium]
MTKKALFNVIGILAVTLAILGIFLPLLPTTPFLLLASACFMRGSTRLHYWLHNNKTFGVYLTNIQSGLGIPRRTKIIAISLLWISLGFSAWQISWLWLQCLLLIPGIAVTIYLLKMKTLSPGDQA